MLRTNALNFDMTFCTCCISSMQYVCAFRCQTTAGSCFYRRRKIFDCNLFRAVHRGTRHTHIHKYLKSFRHIVNRLHRSVHIEACRSGRYSPFSHPYTHKCTHKHTVSTADIHNCTVFAHEMHETNRHSF